MTQTGATHLEDQHSSVRHRQAELGALAVLGWVLADAVHLQAPGDLQQLVVGHGWGLPAAVEGKEKRPRMNVSAKHAVRIAVRLSCFSLVVLKTDVFHIFAISGHKNVQYYVSICRHIILSRFVLYCMSYHFLWYNITLYNIVSYCFVLYYIE